MAKLKFGTPLSETGVRLMHIDLTEPLKYANEVLTGTNPTVTASPTGIVTITNVQVNTAILTNDDGSTAAIGKAIQWKVTVNSPRTSKVLLRVSWAVAGGGSADTHEIELPLDKYVTE